MYVGCRKFYCVCYFSVTFFKAWWCMPAILAIQEAKAGGLPVGGQPGKSKDWWSDSRFRS
jgi:hypothetical protein